ncbi:MAG TPA: alpha-amylase family glycosyl hydrolase [Gammaproteobacteria bacterium]
MAATAEAWWRRAVIYEIYVRSFQDTDGNGIGHLDGVRERLDYLEWLGIDAIWLSPFYVSPMRDFGYDVADYTAVDPIFGTMEDFDRLLADVHRRGMRLLIDLVPNHTSDRHAWFRESASSRTSPKRDWYLWADPSPAGGPPNNWRSEFGGPAWTWHEATGQYYYHAFLPEQPDLNWRNPAVRAAIADVMRFWLDKGVDGFRVDVLWHLVKDERLRDNPPNPAYDPERDSPYNALLPTFSADHPDVHDAVAYLRSVVDEYDERLMIGEVYLPIGKLIAYYGVERSGAHLPFNFHLLEIEWEASKVLALIDEYDASVPEAEWPNWVLGNHDRPRIASRVGREQARIGAMLLLTLRGTPTLYYGDEIGMRNLEHLPPQKVQDPRELNVPGRGLGRDPYRSPMQWTAGPNAGFSDAEPWLPVAPDAAAFNVTVERDDPTSFLSLYKALIDHRRRHAALCDGRYRPLPLPPPLLAYERAHGGERLLVVLNFGAAPATFDPPPKWRGGRAVLSTLTVTTAPRDVGRALTLRGHEGLLILPPR